MKEALGVVLLAYGSPENLDEMGDFLTDIRGGKSLPEEAVVRFRKRYEETGGPSPLNRITREQANALQQYFHESGKSIQTFVGMAHCPPRIRDAVRQARQAGIKHLIGLPMAPHYSTLSTGKYQRLFLEACKHEFQDGKTSCISHFYDEENILQYFTREIENHLHQIRQDTPLIFTAHSLPEKILAQGDPYPEQFRANALEIARRLGIAQNNFTLAYQSKGMGTEKWLGPSVEEVVNRYAELGKNQALLCPIGFVCDHIEILYDLDVELPRKVKPFKIFRTKSLNTDSLFISALAHRIEEHLKSE